MGVPEILIHTPSMTTPVYNKPAFQNTWNTIFSPLRQEILQIILKQKSLTVISLSNISFLFSVLYKGVQFGLSPVRE